MHASPKIQRFFLKENFMEVKSDVDVSISTWVLKICVRDAAFLLGSHTYELKFPRPLFNQEPRERYYCPPALPTGLAYIQHSNPQSNPQNLPFSFRLGEKGGKNLNSDGWKSKKELLRPDSQSTQHT